MHFVSKLVRNAMNILLLLLATNLHISLRTTLRLKKYTEDDIVRMLF